MLFLSSPRISHAKLLPDPFACSARAVATSYRTTALLLCVFFFYQDTSGIDFYRLPPPRASFDALEQDVNGGDQTAPNCRFQSFMAHSLLWLSSTRRGWTLSSGCKRNLSPTTAAISFLFLFVPFLLFLKRKTEGILGILSHIFCSDSWRVLTLQGNQP